MTIVQDVNGRYLCVPPVDPNTIRQALPGQYRVVQEDPSDSDWPSGPEDCVDLDAVRECLDRRHGFLLNPCLVVYDDHCKRVHLDP